MKSVGSMNVPAVKTRLGSKCIFMFQLCFFFSFTWASETMF